MKSTKKSLFLSTISLVLCFAMLLGTTYAWFTDEVTSGTNKIKAGNLDVDLIMWDSAGTTDGYRSIGNEEGEIFGGANSLVAQNNHADTLWEPGKTQIVYLGVRNLGNLALKYNIMLNVKGDLAKKLDGETVESALEYAIIDGATYIANHEALESANWTTVRSQASATDDIKEGVFKAAENGCLDLVAQDGTKNETDYFVLAVHMKEDAGNAYKEKDVTIDVTVIAGQVEAEDDSFDNTYDKDAPYADYVVTDTESMKAALEEINNAENPGEPITIALGDDFTYTEQPLTVSNGGDVTIDLNGNNLGITNQNSDGIVVEGGATVKLTNSGDEGKFTFTTENISNDAIYIHNTEDGKKSELIIEDVEVEIDTGSAYGYIHAYAENGTSEITMAKDAEITVKGSNRQIAAIIADSGSVINMMTGEINVNVEYTSFSQNNDAVGIVLMANNGRETAPVLNFGGDAVINVNSKNAFAQGIQVGQAYSSFVPVVNMTGGKINVGGEGYGAAITASSYADINVTGGLITVNVTSGTGYAFDFQYNPDTYGKAKYKEGTIVCTGDNNNIASTSGMARVEQI